MNNMEEVNTGPVSVLLKGYLLAQENTSHISKRIECMDFVNLITGKVTIKQATLFTD
jgi:hypothetical protein